VEADAACLNAAERRDLRRDDAFWDADDALLFERIGNPSVSVGVGSVANSGNAGFWRIYLN
jgi:hypothetical protein